MKTVSLELAKQLKEAGFPQEISDRFMYRDDGLLIFDGDVSKRFEYFVAPTASEIAILIDENRVEGGLKSIEEAYLNVLRTPTLDLRGEGDAAMMAMDCLVDPDVMGKMWLYLKGKNLL